MHHSTLVFGTLVACVLIMGASSCIICSKPSCSCAVPPLNPKLEFYKKYPLILRLKTKLYNKLHNELKDVVCLDCAAGTQCQKCVAPTLYCTPVPPLAAKKEILENLIMKETAHKAPCVALPAPPAPCAAPIPACVAAPAYAAPQVITGQTVVKQVPNSSEEEGFALDGTNLWHLLQGSSYMPHIETTKTVCGF